jgi:hypothetical protein
MKKLILAVAIVSLAWFGLAKADSITPQDFVNNLSQVPGKVQSHISMEIEKTKAYQADQWTKMKADLLKLKNIFIKQ